VMSSKLVDVLQKKSVLPPPLWMMRQAGRYLPEYRQTREMAGSFWKMCMAPELAAEVTIQPVRRFGFDAAIIFSDILVVPAALGLDVRFEDGTGPRLVPVSSASALERSSDKWAETLDPVYQALRTARSALDPSTALLGFAGAPWTLATYIAAGGGGDEQKAAKLWAYRDPQGFAELVDVLADCIAQHLIGQLAAGASAVQIFDSWASNLAPQVFAHWVVAPTKRIVSIVRQTQPSARIIGFPRGATLQGYELYAQETGVDAVSLDTAVPIAWAVKRLGKKVVLQGNLDPVALLAGGQALSDAIDAILAASRGTPFIFNLGHGILPETPLEHVDALVHHVRSAR
jgi:uroporphyrinogen decarboxylase